MTVRSTQLAVGVDAVAGISTWTVYTVPAGYRTLLKGITLGSVVATTTFTVQLVSGGQTKYLRIVRNLADTFDVQTWIVLNPGDVLQVVTNIAAGGVATWVLSGAELEL